MRVVPPKVGQKAGIPPAIEKFDSIIYTFPRLSIGFKKKNEQTPAPLRATVFPRLGAGTARAIYLKKNWLEPQK
jgi:hypothetical protein